MSVPKIFGVSTFQPINLAVGSRRYMSLESFTGIVDKPSVSLPGVGSRAYDRS